ncbi:hypothetical protein NEMIN01_2093 [Nematocida minor]|uniref:uncharacterized protein n=1 Tax=Nematocida minor TaxID=1912983 RepID=UPI0022205AD3|nr:uncharacterized protein NEMIN01_2093 [Nematocida minor]KAI5192580.1 hypothetical protein NEMIN01_2093 [Nematocida minor]
MHIAVEKHFDLNYTHPMWYIYKRCEYASYLTRKDLCFRLASFMKTKDGTTILRPHAISKEDDSAMKEENIKSCIGAWFLSSAKIITREEDGTEYEELVSDFVDNLQYIPDKKFQIERTRESSKRVIFSSYTPLG